MECIMVPNREQLMPTFTTRWLESVKVSKQSDFIDRSEPGLMFRVAPSGVKSWSLLYRRRGDNKRRRLKLGRFPEVGLAAARAKAIRLKEAIADGADPAAPAMEPQNVETIDQLLNRYLQDSPPASAKWRNEVERIFRANVRPAIGEKKLNTVKRTDVLAIVNAMKDRGAGVAANRTLAAIRRAFNWAVAEEYMDANPAARIPRKVKEDPRNRALGEAEIRAFWLGLDDAPMTAGIKLALRIALTTGQRIDEILHAPRSEVDLGRAEWLIPASRAKNGASIWCPCRPWRSSCSVKRWTPPMSGSSSRTGRSVTISKSMPSATLCAGHCRSSGSTTIQRHRTTYGARWHRT
jgi:Arm domain-containing DNA-binding protein/integrase-like protein